MAANDWHNPELSSVSIVVVDDDYDIAHMNSLVLQARGYRVRVAHNGQQAINLIDEALPDCILLDVAMPGTDAFGVIEHLAQRKDFPLSRIILQSGNLDHENMQRARYSSVSRFLRKPYTMPEMLDCVVRCLQDNQGNDNQNKVNETAPING